MMMMMVLPALLACYSTLCFTYILVQKGDVDDDDDDDIDDNDVG